MPKRLSKQKVEPDKVLKVVLLILVVVRIFVGLKVPIWIIPGAAVDDWLFIRYSMLGDHFGNPSEYSLVKTMSYPLLLALIHGLGISYRLGISLLWVVAAFSAYFVFKRLTRNRIFLGICFAVVLFSPTAFDVVIGLRVYRNAIVTPCTFIVVFAMAQLLLGVILKDRRKKVALLATWLGFTFSFFYYIKEASTWSLGLLLIVVISCVALSIVRNRGIETPRGMTGMIAILIIPVLLFAAFTNIYKAVNYRYFGVYEIVTRTEGVYAEFTARVLSIDDPEKTKVIWVPYSTVQKMRSVSPTLQEHPELMEKLLSLNNYGDMEENGLTGDHFFWHFHHALARSGLFQSEQQAEELMSRINADLDTAFENGTLKKYENKIYLSGQAPGRTFEEILDLRRPFIEGLRTQSLYWGYSAAGNTPEDIDRRNDPNLVLTNYMLNDNIESSQGYNISEHNLFVTVANTIVHVYQILAYPMVLLGIIGFIVLVVKFITRRANIVENCSLGIIAVSILLTLIIAFGIAWWGEWLTYNFMQRYSLPIVAFMQVAELFGGLYALRSFKAFLQNRKAKREV